MIGIHLILVKATWLRIDQWQSLFSKIAWIISTEQSRLSSDAIQDEPNNLGECSRKE